MEEQNLDEMRKQIAILNTKLEKQDIINERMMLNVVSSKTNSMKRPMIISIICAVFVIVVSPVSLHVTLGCSWYFIIGTDIFMAYCMLREYLFKRQLNNNIVMSANLLDVAKMTAQFKKAYRRYTLTNMCLLLPAWVCWLIVETLMSNSSQEAIFFIVAMLIGLAIGSVIGLRMYFHIQHEASDIISEIEE